MIYLIFKYKSNQNSWFWYFGEFQKISQEFGSKAGKIASFKEAKDINDEFLEELLFEIMKRCPPIDIFDVTC